MALTINDLQRLVGSLPEFVEANKNQIQIEVCNRILGELLGRIFNDGKAASGEQIGNYSAKYKKFREELGRQTEYVDLQLTDELFRNVQIGTSKGDTVIGIVGEDNTFKAADNERRFKKDIFKVGDSEIDSANEAFVLSLQAIIKKLFEDGN